MKRMLPQSNHITFVNASADPVKGGWAKVTQNLMEDKKKVQRIPLMIRLVFAVMALPFFAFAQMPQGSLSASEPLCGPGPGQLTWTASAGTGPFTVVYNDGVSNRTVTGVVSGNSFNVFTNPVANTTTYNLVSVTGADAAVRSSGFTAGSATITVKPKPTITANPATQTICSGASISTVTLTSNLPGAVFTWNRDNIAGVTGGGGLAGFDGNGNISGSFTNSGSSPATVGIQARATVDGCESAITNINITVNPAPVASSLTNRLLCAGSTSPIIVLSGAASSFSWTNDNTSIGLAASGNGNIPSFTAVNTTSTEKVANITVTPVYTNVVTCNGAPQNFTIRVNPTLAISSSLTPPAVCSGSIFSYTPATNVAGIISPVYSWSRAAVSGISNSAATGSGIVNETLVNTTTSPINVIYVYTLTANVNGITCTGGSYNVVVSVKPLPTVSLTPSGKQNICNGAPMTPVTIKNPNNLGGTTFSWTRTRSGSITGLPASGSGSTISGTLTNTGSVFDTTTFTGIATTAGCSVSSAPLYVIVAASITENKIIDAFISEVSLCGLTKQISIAADQPDGGGSSYTYVWQSSTDNVNFSDIAGATDSTLVYNTNNNVYLRRIAISGVCEDISNVKLVDAPGANASNFFGACTGGSGYDVIVTASYKDAIYKLQSNSTGSWVDVAGQAPITGTGLSINFSNNKLVGDYRVVAEVPGMCTTILPGTATLNANDLPAKPSSTSSVSPICLGGSSNITALVPGATAGNGAAVYWYTVPSGGIPLNLVPVPSGTNYSVSPTTTTTYYAKSIFTTSGCKSSTRTEVTVVVNPVPTMTSVDSVGVCSTNPVNIPFSNDQGTGVTYTWVATDNPNTTGESLSPQTSGALINTLINHTYVPQTVIYTVTPTITATGCTGPAQTVKVTVLPATLISPQALTLCSGTPFEVDPQAEGSTIVIPGTQYTWAAPTGTGFTGGVAGMDTLVNGTLTNTTTGNVVATYMVTPSADGCSAAPFEISVTLKPAPIVTDQQLSICSGTFSIPPFTGTNVIPAGTTYSWNPPTGISIGGIAAGTNETSISGNLVNTSSPSVPATATYVVTPSVGGCDGVPFTLMVNLNFAPPANTAVWGGFFNNDWCNAANWQCGIVPNSITDAVIPTGSPNQPAIMGGCNAAARNLDVQGAATLDLGTGSNIEIFSSIVNTDPARYTLSGKVTFAGGNQTIPVLNYTGLGVNGGGEKTLVGPTTVKGELDLINGVIKSTSANMLTISETGSATAGSSLSYVEGPLTRLTNSTSTYNFPVGDNGDVRPATVTPISNAPSSYTVFYHPAATGGNVPGPDLLAVQTNGYWDINKNIGADAKVGMYYKNPNGLAANASTTDWSNGQNPCDACNVAVVIVDGSSNWNFTSGSGFAPNETSYWQTNNFVDSRQLLGTSGRYSFGYASNTILPVQLISFAGVLQGNNARLSWKVGLADELSSTEIQHSFDGNKFEKVGSVDANGSSDYGFTHPGLQNGAHFYRLVLKDKTGKITYSYTVLLVVGKNITIIKGLRPTLVTNLTYVDVQSAVPQSLQAQIVDVAGRSMSIQKANLVTGMNTFKVNTQFLMPGMYSIKLQTADGVVATFKFIKER